MEEKIEKGQQIGQLPKRDVLTGNEQFPFQEDRENGSITPNALKSFISSGKGGYMSYITEYNVSIHHPSSGIDSGNKYTLEGAIVQVPEDIRTVGLKVSFLNNSGLVETWEFAGGVFENIENWKSNEDKLTDIRDEAISKIKEVESDAISNFSSQRVTPDMLSESTKQFINASGGGTINNLADDEDLVSVDKGESLSVLKFADRAYNPVAHIGKGYKILRKNVVNGKNILTQEMINQPDTIYEIRYDFNLDGAEINIPTNCTLLFKGGKIFNGKLKGKIENDFTMPEWFKDSDNNDWHDAFQQAIDICTTIKLSECVYDIYQPITIYVYTSIYGSGIGKTEIVSHIKNDFLIYQNYSKDGITPLSKPWSFCTIENLSFCYEKSGWVDDKDIQYNEGSKCILKESYLKLDKIEFKHFEVNIYAPNYSDNLYMINCINDCRSFLKKPGYNKFKDANIIYLNNGDNLVISNCQWFSCYFRTCSNVLLLNNIQVGIRLDYSQCCVISHHLEETKKFGISLNNSKLNLYNCFMHIPEDYSELIRVYRYGSSYIDISTLHITYKNGSDYEFKQGNLITAERDGILYCTGKNVFVDTNDTYKPASVCINDKIIDVGDSDFKIYNNELIQTQIYKGDAVLSGVELTNTTNISFEDITLQSGIYKYKLYSVIDEKRKLYKKNETELSVNYTDNNFIKLSFYNYNTCNTKYMIIRTSPDNTKHQIIVHPIKSLNPAYYDNGIGLYGNEKWQEYSELENINDCDLYIYDSVTNNCTIHAKAIPKYGEWIIGDMVVVDGNTYTYNGKSWLDASGTPSSVVRSGITGERPQNVLAGFCYFDKTINKPVWWNGSSWTDANGATV